METRSRAPAGLGGEGAGRFPRAPRECPPANRPLWNAQGTRASCTGTVSERASEPQDGMEPPAAPARQGKSERSGAGIGAGRGLSRAGQWGYAWEGLQRFWGAPNFISLAT